VSYSLGGFQLGESYFMPFVPPVACSFQFLVPNPTVVLQIVQTIADLFEKREFLFDDSHIKP
jgi:hypothetical protein